QNGTISFFGACRPTSATSGAAVSYRYWIKAATGPDQSDAPCQSDPHYDASDPDFCAGKLFCDYNSGSCVCQSDCGGPNPGPGQTCTPTPAAPPAACEMYCRSDCGGTCGQFHTCDTATCSCTCAQTATCAPGFTFVDDGATCGCVCDTAALDCGAAYA